jgi:hypothetical protein
VVGGKHGGRGAVVVVVVTAVAPRALLLPLQKLGKASFPW